MSRNAVIFGKQMMLEKLSEDERLGGKSNLSLASHLTYVVISAVVDVR